MIAIPDRKKQTLHQRRILTASVMIAAVIVSGSTFAWQTSEDSVTNRLTSDADYGVSITETFTPPADWLPGQEINKDVGAVNTGNISAFVKLTLSNALEVSYESKVNDTDVTIDDATGAPSVQTTSGNQSTELLELSGSYEENEVLAAQAGGFLVAAYTASTDTSGSTTYAAISGVTLGKMGSKYNTYTGTTLNNKSAAPAAGYYIFRNGKKSSGSWTYSGFYYGGSKYYKINVICTTDPTYNYGKVTDDTDVNDNKGSDGIADGGEFTVTFATKETKAAVPTFSEYDKTKNRITATCDVLQNDSDISNNNRTDDNIIFYINLAQNAIGTSGDNWTYGGLNAEDSTKGIAADTRAYFYLNQLLEPGKTSENLIDSIKLSAAIKEDAYLNLTYDLNVDLDSVQAVYTLDTTTGSTTIDTASSAAAAKEELLKTGEVGTGDYAFDTVTVTPGTKDENGNIISATVGWTKQQ